MGQERQSEIEAVTWRLYQDIANNPGRRLVLRSGDFWGKFPFKSRRFEYVQAVQKALDAAGVVYEPSKDFGSEDKNSSLAFNLAQDRGLSGPEVQKEFAAQRQQTRANPGKSLFTCLSGLVVLFAIGFFFTTQMKPNPSMTNSPSEQMTITPTSRLQIIVTPTQASNMPSRPPAKTGFLYFTETAHTVQAFAEPYMRLGGVISLGYPLTEIFIERDSATGRHYWVQYFEKAVLQYHPELAFPNNYQLAPLGAWQFSRKYSAGVPEPKPLPGDTSYKFPETNYTVSGPFLQYWHDGGEVARFGYPLSESFEERNEMNGEIYIVQYFERAVMEYHAEYEAPNNVQLMAIGSFRLRELYPDGTPDGASNPVPAP
jgi:hypothetical protein